MVDKARGQRKTILLPTAARPVGASPKSLAFGHAQPRHVAPHDAVVGQTSDARQPTRLGWPQLCVMIARLVFEAQK